MDLDQGKYTSALLSMSDTHSFVAPGAEGWEEFEQTLLARLGEAAMTKNEYHMAQACLRELERTVCKLGPGWRIRPFGSLCNGFAVRGSDLDVTCCKDAEQDTNPSSSQILDLLLPLIQTNNKFRIVDVIRSAMVPILKVRFQQALDVDISFKNMGPLLNTQLLRAYSQLDPCVRDLVVMVKLWAKAVGVCGAANGHLSAYSLTLMAIYFLQVEPQLHMPCLPTTCFNGEVSIPQAAKVAWSCKLRRVELLYRFMFFFVGEFRWGSEVVSIRVGTRNTATDCVFDELRGRLDSRLHIEDPFLLSRNLHCVLRVENEHVLYAKLWEVVQAMQYGNIPFGLRSISGAVEPRIGRVAVPSPATSVAGRLVNVNMDGQQYHGVGSLAMANAKPCDGGDRSVGCGGSGSTSSNRSAPHRVCFSGGGGSGGVGSSSSGNINAAGGLVTVGAALASMDATIGDGSAEVHALRSGGSGTSASSAHQQRHQHQHQHQHNLPHAMSAVGPACGTTQTIAMVRPLGTGLPPSASPSRGMGGVGLGSGGVIAPVAAAAAVPPVRILNRASLPLEASSAPSRLGSERSHGGGSNFAPLPHEVPMTVLQSKWCF
mmetsp:Transcript_11982/g.29724  ORF Transcript_11982/g.29724 Transcript_11982/m.29724 type:complete len:600 (-) Transcript_11982:80-1879(-)